MKRILSTRACGVKLALAVCTGTILAAAATTASAGDEFGFPAGFPAAQSTSSLASTSYGAFLLQDASGDADEDDEESEESATVPLADYEKLMDRVGDLESSWEKYQDKLKDDATAKKKKPAYKLNGRVHLDNWNFLDDDAGINELETGDPLDDPEDRWDFRRIRLTWSGTVPHNMLYRIQIDFNNPSSAEMKDVYLGFNNLPHNQTFLIGNQKRPIGLDHLNSSRHNVFAERPLSVETFNEDARRLGAAMYGHTDDEMINWRYGAFLLENISRDGRFRGDFDEAGLYGRLAASLSAHPASDSHRSKRCPMLNWSLESHRPNQPMVATPGRNSKRPRCPTPTRESTRSP